MTLAVRTAEAARQLGVSPRTVQRWLREGRLASKRVGRCRLIPVAEVQRLVDGDPKLDPMRLGGPEYGPPKPAVKLSEWSRKTLRDLRR